LVDATEAKLAATHTAKFPPGTELAAALKSFDDGLVALYSTLG